MTFSTTATALLRSRARVTRLIKWGVAFAIAAPLLYVAVAPWTFSEPALRQEIALQVQRATGLSLDTQTRFAFALLPRPQIKIEAPVFADPDSGVAVHADHLKGSLRLLPLLAGRLEMAEVALLRPEASFDLDVAEARLAAHSSTRTPREMVDSAHISRLGVIAVTDGSAHVVSKKRNLDISIADVALVLDWRRADAPISLTGTAMVRGEKTRLAFWLARPADVMNGDSSPVTVRIKNNVANLTANGNLAVGDQAQFSGRLSGGAASLRDALAFFGLARHLPAPFQGFSLAADAAVTRNAVNLANVSLSADGNSYEGALALRLDNNGNPLVSGTLAANSLDLSPFAAEAPALNGDDGPWSREPLDLRNFAWLDLDLRLSASRVRLGRIQGDDAALSVMAKNGRLELGLGEIKAYKGVFKGRLSAQSMPQGGVEGRASLGFIGVEASPLLWDLWGRSALAGAATGSFILGGSGESFSQIVRTLDGRGQIQINNGQIAGVDFEQVLRRIEKRPLTGTLELRGGSTAFDTVTANMRVSRGVAAIEDGVMIGKGARIDFAGQAQMGDRTLKVEAAATQADVNGAARKEAPQFQFNIAGPWESPSLIFDAQGLIRRSGAAQPLLPAPQAGPAPDTRAPAAQ